jgi:hypothetical protein
VYEERTQIVIFATFAETDEHLGHAYYLAESIRSFAGRFSEAPVWVFYPDDFNGLPELQAPRFARIKAELISSHTPEEARWFYFSGKTFAAACAEQKAESETDVLVWMDEDTIVLSEPSALNLEAGCSFAYRPVMHNRSGALFNATPNPFWQRIHEVLSIRGELLFPMVTPVDRQKIRAYFNAGLLVTRPELGVLSAWADSFRAVCEDSTLVQMCREDVTHRIFLHQAALVGAVLHKVERDAMKELPAAYNYPLFFERQWDAVDSFDRIDDIVTLRYDTYFRNPDPNWANLLHGPSHVVDWLRDRLGKETT